MFKIILGTIPNIGLSNQGIFAIETLKTSLKTANDTNVIQHKNITYKNKQTYSRYLHNNASKINHRRF